MKTESLVFRLQLDSKKFKSGFVSIIGLPNAGKSSLINAILEEKVFAVSAKKQTTRNNVKGIYNSSDSQIVFIDTPGYHNSDIILNKFFIKESRKAIKEADIVVLLLKADENSADFEDNKALLGLARKSGKKLQIYISKADLMKNKTSFINDVKKKYAITEEIIPVSIKDKIGIKKLVEDLKELLPLGSPYFDTEILTDSNMRFLSAEIIREKIFRYSQDEIPYSTAVDIVKYEETLTLHKIYADILVERQSQKIILIGDGGSFLKKIGTEARKDIEKLCGAKVYLELFIKVKTNWTKDERVLKELGYL